LIIAEEIKDTDAVIVEKVSKELNGSYSLKELEKLRATELVKIAKICQVKHSGLKSATANRIFLKLSSVEYSDQHLKLLNFIKSCQKEV